MPTETDSANTSRLRADQLIAWLREYADSRINSNLIDERRCIPPYVVLDFGNRGLFGLRVPMCYGGLELAHVDVARVLEQLGSVDLTLATFVSSHANGVHTIQKYGSFALRAELLPKLASGRELSAFALTEPCAGSNPRAIQTEAVADGRGGWVLNGEKYLVDSGAWASVITVFARTWARAEGWSRISAFAVRQGTPGLVIGGESLTMGLRGMVQNSMSLRGVRVGTETLLGSLGTGMEISQDTLSLARLNLSAKSIGAMKRCLQLLYRYAGRRPIATGMLWDNPVTQSRVVPLVCAVSVVEALVERISRGLDEGEEIPPEAFLACKVAASEYLWETANALVQALGGRGYVDTNMAPRILRDARSFLLSEGPTETLLMYLGSRVMDAPNELERFIGGRLGAHQIASRLKEITERIRARCSNGSLSAKIGEPGSSYWSASLVGEVAMWAILAAAAENGKGQEVATSWARSKFEGRIEALAEAGPAEWALGQSKAALDLIATYAEAIGNVEQSLPAAEGELDLLLRRDSPPSATLSRDAAHRVNPSQRDACVHQLIEQQVARVPTRVAVISDGETVTYAELDARANRLARKLRQAGVRREVPVGLCVERSADLLVGLLAILKAGGAYVPLDPTHPRRRLTQILDETQVPVIVAHEHLARMLPEHSASVIAPDAWKDVETFNDGKTVVEGPGSGPGAGNCAYVLYTSGSTGRPKGVEVCHRAVVNVLLSLLERPGFSENDVLVAVTTISFDIAAVELFLPLVAGGRVVIASSRTAVDGVALAKLIEQSGATVLQATPATWQMLLASDWQGKPGLKALCGGDTLPRDLARGLRARTGSLWNLYGPTETTIWSSIEEVTDDSRPIAIGVPIANTHIYLLNENFEPVSAGVPGEIFIGGEGVARGYWKRPDLTAERFLPDPFRPAERMYRTGDLARFLKDGRIEHLGRLDHQVKIRGFRVELGEIEMALVSHEAVREVVVMAPQSSPGGARLVAYMTLAPGTPRSSLIPELQAHVRNQIPSYMAPSAFVFLDRLPLTPHGKLDRHALPPPGPEDTFPEERRGAPYASAAEEEVGRIWSNVLRFPVFDRDADFFALGGHSLQATQIVSRLRVAFGVEIPIALMFERPTVAALAQAVDDALKVQPSPRLEPVAREGKLALSFAQERLWFLDQLEPDSAWYNVPVALTLDGPLEVEALRRSFEQVVERHEALRTRFEALHGAPFQVIEPGGSWPLPVIDLESLAEEKRQTEKSRLMQQEATRPFNLRSGPLLRTTLLRLSPEKHVLLVTTHHVASDAWSMEVLLGELGVLYSALSQGRSSPLAPLPIQYADYALLQHKWLQGPVLKAQLAYWRQRLAGLPGLNLPGSRPRPRLQSYRGATHAFAISTELSWSLQELAQKHGATMFMTLLAAWQLLLSHYSGQEDFGIGFPIANRLQPEVEGLIGFFANTLVLRADLAGNPTYEELLARVRERAVEAYAHSEVPFQRLVEDLGVARDLSRNPLFQVMFVMHHAPAAEFASPGLRVTSLAVTTGTAKVDLTLFMRVHAGQLLGEMEYSTDLFDNSTIELMSRRFQTVLEAVVATPEQRITQLLPLIPSAHR